MLRFEAITSKGERYSLSCPVSVTLSRDLYTPADSLTAVFPFRLPEEIGSVTVYEGENEIFRGVADEQITIVGDDVKTKLVCRSMAALLLDNEAYPQTFTNVSAGLLFRRYAKPLGFTDFTGSDKTLWGEFRVSKGMSCWQVFENFCSKVYGTYPLVQGDAVKLEGADSTQELVLSNAGTGVPYASLEYNKLRCKLISRVCVKTAQGGEYSSFVEDRDALSRGIVRERFVNAADLSAKTLADADKLIASARLKSEALTVTVPCAMTNVLACSVAVCDSTAGELSGFYVTGIRYSLSEKGESTRLTLGRKEN